MTAPNNPGRLDFRFARRRDGSLRLRVSTNGEFSEQVGAFGFRYHPAGAPVGTQPFAHLSVDGDGIVRIIDALEQSCPAGRDIVTAMRARHAALLAAAPPVRPAPGSVVDDEQLRAAVRRRQVPEGVMVIDEMGVAEGQVRADVAVLHPDQWLGIELKGQTDTLRRLPGQVQAYSAVFDRCELVTVDAHLAGASRVVPSWWQISVGGRTGELEVVRPGSPNPSPDAFARAQLLWRDEALAELQARDLAAGMKAARRALMWERLAEHVSVEELRLVCDRQMRGRQGWLARHVREPGEQ